MTPIETQIGFVTGRDGFYLDSVTELKSKKKLNFKGEINTSLASKYSGKAAWVKYGLTFHNTVSYLCESVDDSNFQEECSFVEMDSKDCNIKKFIFATYDHVYEIEAESYFLELGEERP